jgi:hypothetical protein
LADDAIIACANFGDADMSMPVIQIIALLPITGALISPFA